MRFIILLLTLSVLPLHAGMYLQMTVDNQQELQQLSEALQIGDKMRHSLTLLRKHAPNDPNIAVLSEQIEKFEQQMYKNYQMIPGLTYSLSITTGTIYLLIPETKIDEFTKGGYKITPETLVTTVKDAQGADVKCFKVVLKHLNNRASVMNFTNTINAAESIRQQIKQIENQFTQNNELKSNPKLQEGMTKLKATLQLLDDELLKKFDIQPLQKYSFEPETGAIYLNLEDEDLIKLGKAKKQQVK